MGNNMKISTRMYLKELLILEEVGAVMADQSPNLFLNF